MNSGLSALGISINQIKQKLSKYLTNFNGANLLVLLDNLGRLPAIDGSQLTGIATGGRTILTADRTYYVRTDGNDFNQGLTDTSGGAFLTPQKALDVTGSLDISIYTVVIQLGTGTFTNCQLVLKSPVGSGKVILRGDTSNTNQTSYVIYSKTATSSGNENVLLAENLTTNFIIEGLTITVENSDKAISVSNSYITFKNCRFKKGGGSVDDVLRSNFSYIKILGSLTLEGSFVYTLNIGYNSIFDAFNLGSNKIIGVSYSHSFVFFLGRLGARGDVAGTTATGITMDFNLDASSTFRTAT